MDEKVINFIEFWNELRDIYAKEYPEAYCRIRERGSGRKAAAA